MSGFRIGKHHAEFLDVRLTRRTHTQSDYWDGNWITAEIDVGAGGFRALIGACLRADELRDFRDALARVYSFESSEAEFRTMEQQLSIGIKGDGLGHFSAECEVVDSWETGNRLTFTLNFDQTELRETLKGLDGVVKEFPVVGSPND